MTDVSTLRIKIFADGANLSDIRNLSKNPLIKGFTTNPTLMRRAGVENYVTFARQVLEIITDRPVSFEVFADDPEAMKRQAREISSWGDNVNVKIPITNTRGESMAPIFKSLSNDGVKLNITAIMTLEQIRATAGSLNTDVPSIVSVFAGRIADTGRDPVPMMREAVDILSTTPRAELLWASPREVMNVFHADHCGAHIITLTHDLIAKIAVLGKSLDQFSLETVQMFHRDADAAGYSINRQP
ncbi:MAG: transaldolase [Rhodospirillales bacterium]|jgi:transaldolase|nr:transaldolase [Rhodospirillales bacterium]MBT4039014.1 transaldolase [Rhodospirillales bacterium]MBT5522162.1 transaldolase [Rhodospirillales bacterium]MBT6110725.1 transaldolase [Rhodospirillales bacterium]MBT7777032.1 transaldolase [Rhodospirillales bacterium]